jgi:signal peptidase II
LAATASWIRKLTPWLVLALVIIGLDQWSKWWIVGHLQLGDAQVVTDWFRIVRWHNTGAAFSVLAGAAGWQREFFAGIALIASVVIIYLLARHGDKKLFALALAGILGGAIGNLIDRLQHGYVVDFLLFHYTERWVWPAFNLADSAIVGSAALLVVDELLRVRKAR